MRTIVVQHGDWYDLVSEAGAVLVHAESWQVCANVQDALEQPGAWVGTECGEVADAIRKAVRA